VTATPLPSSARNVVPRRVWLFVTIVGGVAAVVLAATLPSAVRQLAGSDWRSLWRPVLYAAGLVVTERFVVKVPIRNHRFSVGVTDLVIVLGVVFIDLPLLVLATALGIAVSQFLTEPYGVKRLFNVLQYMLSVAAAAALTSAVLALIGRWHPFGLAVDLRQPFRPSLAFVWVIGMVAFFLVNYSLVALAVSL
jgi:hypothetical protein